MKSFLFLILIALPIFSYAQMADTAAVRKEVDSLVNRTLELIQKENFEEGLRLIQQAEEKCKASFGEENALYANCLNQHGVIYYYQGQYAAVEPIWVKYKNIVEKVLGKEHPFYPQSLNDLAALYFRMGQYEKAEPLLIESKNSSEKTFGKTSRYYTNSINTLAVLYQQLGKYDLAELLLLEAKSILEKTVGKEVVAYGYNLSNLGLNYYMTARYEAAIQSFLEVKNIYAKTLGKEHSQYANVLQNLAGLYEMIGQYDKVEVFDLEAKTIYEKTTGKESPEYANLLYNLSIFYIKMGRYKMAEPFALENKIIREKTLGNIHPDYAHAISNLANLYHLTGRYESSERLYLEAKNIYEKTLGKLHPYYTEVSSILAGLYLDMKRYEVAESLFLEAKATYEQNLGKDHPHYAFCLLNLANLLTITARYDLAEPLFLEAKSIFEKTLGRIHRDYDEELKSLATFYWKTNRQSEAAQYYLEAASIQNTLILQSTRYLSEQELAAYSKLFIDNFNLFYSFAQMQPNVDSALTAACFDQSLFYKGFLLTASNRIRHLATSDSTSQQQFELLTSYNRRLAAEYTKPIAEREGVEELENKANTIEKELVRTVAGFGEALRQVNWKEVQQHLKPNEAAVEFLHYQFYKPEATDSTMYAALVLRPGDQQPHFVPLFEEKQLNALLPVTREKQNNEFISTLYMKTARTKDSTGLYELIWKPLDSLLTNTTTVYCAPSGLLHRINLSAIASDRNKTMADRFQLVQLGSTRSLVVPDFISTSKSNSAILFGGIQYQLDTTAVKSDTSSNLIAATSGSVLSFSYANRSVPMRGENWRFLPDTEKEVQQIQALLKQSKFSTQLYSGKKATEEVFKSIDKQSASPRILHFATHGFFFPDPKDTTSNRGAAGNTEPVFKISDHPMIRSGLMLAGGDYAWQNGRSFQSASEDGILTAYEISQMNLSNTELVVLSACETGLGDIQGSEGVYGLQRAFKIAGVKYLIMSLWKVSDAHTQELMTEFYRQWLQEGRTIRQAFYGAQQKMREKYRFPHLWAGFVLIE